MVAIRFQRIGRNKISRFRLIAIDSRRGPKTPALEILGAYNPGAKDGEKITNLKKERLTDWVKQGAQVSDSAKRILTKEKQLG
ncbi:MAG: 30S ribosomal protein S16 [Elusimicrobia bacterium]|nr:30S ribosomal protein S16 [Elusimicrobiota bacterium]